MTDTPPSRPSRSSARRARKRAVASRPAGAAVPTSTGTPRLRDGRRQHHGKRQDPYANPDSAAIAAYSTLPRPLTVVFDVADGRRVLDALAAAPATADLAVAVAAKLAWTEAYNAALPAPRPATTSPDRRRR